MNVLGHSLLKIVCSYARLLQHVRQDHDAAESLFRQVFFVFC